MKTSTKVLLAFGLLAIFFIPWLWYDNAKEIIIGGDLTVPLKPAEYFFSIFQIWRRVYTGTNSAISLTTLPFYAPMALFDVLGFSLKWVEQLHFGLWLAAPAVSMFYLAGVIFKDHPKKLVAQIVAVVVYLFNTYEVVWVDSARMAVWLGLPLMLAFFINGLRDTKRYLKWAAAIGLTSVITSTAAANPPMFLMMLTIFVFYLLFHLATTPADRAPARLKQIGLFIVVSVIIALLVNLFWVVPYASVLLNDYKGALSSGLQGIQFKDWLDPISTNTSLLNVFRLQGAWDWYAGWNGEPYVPAAAPYQNHPFYLVWSLIVPILAFAALLVKDRRIDRRLTLFWSGLALAGLFFSAGSHLPTGSVYKWLINHFQFLSIYRSPWYKFSTWTVLGYSFLVATTLAAVGDWLSRAKKFTPPFRLVIGPLLLAVFIVGNLIYSSGLVMGRVFPRAYERWRLNTAHVTFPNYFFKEAAWVNRQAGDWRILQLPAQPAFNYKWGLGTLMDMSIFTFHQPTLWWPEQTGSGPAKPGSEALVKAVDDQLYYGTPVNLSRVLGLLNVRYLLEKEDIDHSFYGGRDSPEYLKKKLDFYGFKLARKESPWDFYEIDKADQRPLIFPTSQFIETGPPVIGLFSAAASPNYDPNATYTDQATPRLPTKVDKMYHLIPDIDKAQLIDGQIVLPLTAPKNGSYTLAFVPSETTSLLIDNQPVNLTTTAKGLSAIIDLTAGLHHLTIQSPDGFKNLINDGSFENGLWEPRPLDAERTAPGPADFQSKVIDTASNGKQSVEISSRNHSAALRRGIDEFDVRRHYLLSFDYKYVTGNQPKYGVWQQNSFISEPSGELEKTPTWKNLTTVFQPRPFTAAADIFLYADPGKHNTLTVADYDNVTVIKLPKILDTLSLTSQGQTKGVQPLVSYRRLTPTHYRVELKNVQTPFFLNFLEQFDPGWQVKIAGRAVPTNNHFPAYAYANGWYLEKTGNYSLDLTFAPQQRFVVSAVISLLAAVCALALVSKKRRKND